LTVRHVDAGHWVPRTQPVRIARWIAEHAAAIERRATRAAARVVLITGAGGGIGRATAVAFAEAGAAVIAVDIDRAAAERTAELCSLLGPRATAHAVDVADPAAMTALAAQVAERHGALDVLVNNAGIAAAGDFLATAVDDWRRVLDVNLWGVIHGCRLFARQMIEAGRPGHIVNVASAAAFQPSRTLPAYATSKAAVLMLSECLRAELAGHGIGVSAVCPGFVATGITNATRFVGDGVDQGALRRRATAAYRRRGFSPDRVADAILDAVARDRAVVTVTPEAAALRWLSRFAPPGVRQWLAGLDALGARR
ncbi:MAG: SDR family NAD(P)-dependent oxidoreductase, partial [Kofleriaceae bacterium]